MTRVFFDLWKQAVESDVDDNLLSELESVVGCEAQREWGQETQISFDRDQGFAVVANPHKDLVILGAKK